MHSSRTAVSHYSWWAQVLHNRLIAMVLAMVVIVPLIAVPADSHLIGISAITFEGFALLLAVTLLWRARWDFSKDKIVSFLRTGANLPVLLLMGLTVALCAASPHKAFGIQGTLQLAAGVLLYFVVGYQFRQSKHLSMLVDTLLFLAIAVSMIAAAQYAATPDARGTALFGNQQPLGSLLMILLPIIASVAIAEKSSRRQLVAQVATVLTAGALMLAQTRSAWIGAAVGFAVIGLLAVRTAAAKRQAGTPGRSLATQKHKLVTLLVISVASLGFVAAMMSQNSGIAGRSSTLTDISNDSSFQDRQDIWRGTLAMIKAHPLTGVGPGLYGVEQHAFTGRGVAVSETSSSVITLASQAHNFYLQTAAEIGLPGLALVLSVLAAFLISAWRRVPRMHDGIRRTLLIGSMGSVAAFAVDAMSSPSWQYGQVSMFLWLVMGIGMGCLRPRGQGEEEMQVVVPARRVVRPTAVVVAALLMCLVVTPTAGIAVGILDSYPQPRNGYSSWKKVGLAALGGGLTYLIFDRWGNLITDNGLAGGPEKKKIPVGSPPSSLNYGTDWQHDRNDRLTDSAGNDTLTDSGGVDTLDFSTGTRNGNLSGGFGPRKHDDGSGPAQSHEQYGKYEWTKQ